MIGFILGSGIMLALYIYMEWLSNYLDKAYVRDSKYLG